MRVNFISEEIWEERHIHLVRKFGEGIIYKNTVDNKIVRKTTDGTPLRYWTNEISTSDETYRKYRGRIHGLLARFLDVIIKIQSVAEWIVREYIYEPKTLSDNTQRLMNCL